MHMLPLQFMLSVLTPPPPFTSHTRMRARTHLHTHTHTHTHTRCPTPIWPVLSWMRSPADLCREISQRGQLAGITQAGGKQRGEGRPLRPGCAHTHTHTHRDTDACTYIHGCEDSHTYTQTHACTHISTLTHTHTHTDLHTHNPYTDIARECSGIVRCRLAALINVY